MTSCTQISARRIELCPTWCSQLVHGTSSGVRAKGFSRVKMKLEINKQINSRCLKLKTHRARQKYRPLISINLDLCQFVETRIDSGEPYNFSFEGSRLILPKLRGYAIGFQIPIPFSVIFIFLLFCCLRLLSHSIRNFLRHLFFTWIPKNHMFIQIIIYQGTTDSTYPPNCTENLNH